jgi:ketosteroid isomerase-like protein
MSTAENKKLVETMFGELSRGNPEGYLAGLADDVQFTIIGKTKFSGLFDGKKNVIEKLLGPLAAQLDGGLTVSPEHIVAEGDTVVMQAQGRSKTKSGKRYDNTYCIVFRIAGGKIAKITEYLDTEMVTEAFGR